jgi:hypothetical protein
MVANQIHACTRSNLLENSENSIIVALVQPVSSLYPSRPFGERGAGMIEPASATSTSIYE